MYKREVVADKATRTASRCASQVGQRSVASKKVTKGDTESQGLGRLVRSTWLQSNRARPCDELARLLACCASPAPQRSSILVTTESLCDTFNFISRYLTDLFGHWNCARPPLVIQTFFLHPMSPISPRVLVFPAVLLVLPKYQADIRGVVGVTRVPT